MPDTGEDDPRLPQELERLIFERAASDWAAKDTSALLLVAKRVYGWIRPLLFQVFVQINSPKFPDFGIYHSLKLEDVGQFAKHLIVGDVQVDQFLSSCPNVHDLALWCGVPILNHLQLVRTLRLTRLSANLAHLPPQEFLGPTFSNLTHLDVIDIGGGFKWDNLAVLADLPKLSHLTLSIVKTDQTSIQQCLLQCKCLRLLIILVESGDFSTLQGMGELLGIKDGRLVLMQGGPNMDKDWENGANGKVDFWVFAELFSLARIGKFLSNPSQRWINNASFDWTTELNPRGKEWYSVISYP